MGGDEFYDIGGDLLDAADAASEFKLVVPENARQHKKIPTTHFWTEAGAITAAYSDSKEEVDKSKTQILTFEVTLAHEGSGKNVGKPLTTGMRINHSALRKGAPKNFFTMSNMALHKLRALMRSVGVEGDLEGGGFSQSLLAFHFPSKTSFSSEVPPLVGRVIYFEVKQEKRELPDGTIKTQAEINKILMPESA